MRSRSHRKCIKAAKKVVGSFLRLIRYPNLLIILLTQVLVYTCLINASPRLSWFLILLCGFATALMAAAGNVINDIFDIEADKVNRPNTVIIGKQISIKSAWFIYSVTNLIAIISELFICYKIGDYFPMTIVIFIILSLWWYSFFLKKKVFVGNFIVALLSSLAIVVVAVFEKQWDFQLSYYFLFAFLLSLQREIIKDMEDVEGDKLINAYTLPIAIGDKKTKALIYVITFLITILLSYFLVRTENTYLFFFLLIFTGFPQFYLLLKIWKAKVSKDFHFISQLIKVIMILGILSMVFIK